MLFRAGHPAHAPGVGPELLTSVATTSHLTLLPPSGTKRGLVYLAQPPEAPLFRDTPGGILEHGEVPSGTLPTRDEAADCATLPVGAHRWLDPAVAADALAIERTALAPLRRDRIPPEPALAVALQESGALTTPQGFVIEASASQRSQITIASVPGADPSALVLTDVRGPSPRPSRPTRRSSSSPIRPSSSTSGPSGTSSGSSRSTASGCRHRSALG